ncbi:MAG: hypothetical protein QM762_28505 [Chryseolinea sp.]
MVPSNKYDHDTRRIHLFSKQINCGSIAGRTPDFNPQGEVIVITVSGNGFPVADSVASIMHAVTVYLPTLSIPDPTDPKKTIGAVNFGCAVTDDGHELPGDYVYRQVNRLQQELKNNFLDQSAVFAKVILNNQVVIVSDVVDNPAPIIAAVKLVKSYQPKLLVLATPVITVDAYLNLRQEVDEVVALETVSAHMVARAFSNEGYFEFTDEPS